MAEPKKVVVVGLGEVGRPLFEIVSRHHQTIGVDIEPVVKKFQRIDVMHICFPFQIKDFVGEVTRRIEHFKPALTIIDSTVAVGTTRAIAERSGAAVVTVRCEASTFEWSRTFFTIRSSSERLTQLRASGLPDTSNRWA